MPHLDAQIPLLDPGAREDAAVRRHWRNMARLSSMGDAIESFLAEAGFDRAPWLVIALAGGIALWFVLPGPAEWLAALAVLAALSVIAHLAWNGRDERSHLHRASLGIVIALALGMGTIWARSAIVGAPAIERATVTAFTARVLDREEQPAQGRVRLVLAMRDPSSGVAAKVRVNVPVAKDHAAATEGAVVRLKARLMPPAPPMVPGAYDFARSAWFQGFAATGSLLGEMAVVWPADGSGPIKRIQRALADHVRSRLGGSPGTIAAAFASGDRGAISGADEDAMRDAGLTHLLSISGLHVSAVIAAGYVVALRLLALWPWLALRVRLPVAAAGAGALAGIGYTLLTGAEVPTLRSCIGALLVLGALALGRQALTLRMVAMAACVVLFLWPEALVGPSFQLSFASVIAIVALHESRWARAFLAPREETWLVRHGRRAVMLLATGLVVEFALMPIVLFHFQRAGIYGALANVIGIPLVTFVSMPLIALALALDLLGFGAPAWWLAGKSLEVLLGLAHWVAAQPGAVKLAPQMDSATFALFLAGGLWLALWRQWARLWGLVPVGVGAAMLMLTPLPDILVTGDGRQAGIVGEGDRLLILRDSRSTYARDNLLEAGGMDGEPLPLAQWPGARCSPDFCTLTLMREGRAYHILMARSSNRVEYRELVKACARADIVIADRRLPEACRPSWLKADRTMLRQTGGLAIYLDDGRIATVADEQGRHGWWRAPPGSR